MSQVHERAPGHDLDASDAAEGSVGVRVPGSSANLGPGFDAFAVAVDVPLVAWTLPRGERRVVAEGEGADELPSDDANLVWRALVAFCERVGVAAPDVSVHTSNAIPLERGMGSSAAAAVAGAALGRALAIRDGALDPRRRPDLATDQTLVDVAASFEGHADNAAAAVLGGLVVCVDGRARRLEPSTALRPVLCVPTSRQSTEAARGLLADAVPLADAAANGARAALVLAGLSGAAAWDPTVLRDVLHEPARLGAMTASGALVAALRDDGLGACLSGAGPSVLVITASGDDDAVEAVRRRAGDGWTVRPAAWDRAGATACPPAVVAGGGRR